MLKRVVKATCRRLGIAVLQTRWLDQLKGQLETATGQLGQSTRDRDGYRLALEQTATELAWARARLDSSPRPHPWPQVGFMHLLKTGGISVLKLLGDRFDPSRVFWGWSAEHFAPLAPRELHPYDLVAGHFSYDHTRLLRPHRLLFTFVREPVDRVLSTYWYFRTWEDELKDHIRETVESARRYSLLDFLKVDSPQVRGFTHDHQAYALASNWQGPCHQTAEAVRAAALAHLEEFLLVGLTERLEESVHALFGLLRWQPAQELPRLNVTPRRQHAAEITTRERDAILEVTQLDAAVYQRACQRFEEQEHLRRKREGA